jgi:hypothetical protein
MICFYTGMNVEFSQCIIVKGMSISIPWKSAKYIWILLNAL